jgi:hypothetical protein
MAVSKKDLPPHPLVKALNPDPTKAPTRALKLFGFLGEGSSADESRLWLDDELTSYVDVPIKAILYVKALADDAGTILWVDPEAKLKYSSVTSHSVQAQFLEGAMTANLAGAPAAGAAALRMPVPTPPFSVFPSQCGPCRSHLGACPPSLPFCPSEAMVPSHCAPCVSVAPAMCVSEAMLPSHCVPCASLPIRCPSEAMAPSHCAPCVSLPQCPSEAMAPSHCAPCPSVRVICPTPTATPSAVPAFCPSAADACPSRIC